MDFRKLLIILGGALVLLIVFFTAKSIFFKDELKPVLGNLVVLNKQLVELNAEAKDKLQDFELQTTAASAANVISSDNYQLEQYYKDKYSKKLPKLGGVTPLKSLQEINVGNEYDSKYRLLANELRIKTSDLANQALEVTNSSELTTLLSNYLKNLESLYPGS